MPTEAPMKSQHDQLVQGTITVDRSDAQQAYDMDWDAYANEIAPRKASRDWAVLRKARESHYRELFRIKPGDRVLDAGCGHGEYCVYALNSGAKVWAFDYATEMTQYTRRVIADAGLQAETVAEGSVLDIPYDDNSFDAVFCLSVIDHLADRDRAFAELARVLKPGGHMYIDVPNRFAWHWRACFGVMRLFGMYPSGKIHFFTQGELNASLRRVGCEPERHLGLTFCPPFSGIYTTDLRRITPLPEWLIKPLDATYLAVEKLARRYPPLRWLCWHNFVRAVKTA